LYRVAATSYNFDAAISLNSRTCIGLQLIDDVEDVLLFDRFPALV